MSQAIYYVYQNPIYHKQVYQNTICQNYIHQNDINQNGTALNASIPPQAVNIPMDAVLDKTTLLTNLGKACNFPNYFSHNWDSAWDCLTDSAVTDLMLDLTSVKKMNTQDFNTFKSMIEDAYRDFGKPQLWVIMPPADPV